MKDLLSLRGAITLLLLGIFAAAFFLTVSEVHFGTPDSEMGRLLFRKREGKYRSCKYCNLRVAGYRSLDTLGEIAVLFIAATGLSALLSVGKQGFSRTLEDSSLVLSTGCRALFPFILLLGVYLFVHGHLTPGGGFQGGAVIGSAFLLLHLGCPDSGISRIGTDLTESFSGLSFAIVGLVGLGIGGYFLYNFLPEGEIFSLFSAGILPLLYILIGLKVGAEFGGIINRMVEET